MLTVLKRVIGQDEAELLQRGMVCEDGVELLPVYQVEPPETAAWEIC